MSPEMMIQILLGEFYDRLRLLSDLVVRDIELPVAPGKIKVIIGMRRSGKTYFVFQQILKLIAEGVDRNCILYINFEDDRLMPLDQEKLARLVDAFYELYPENHEKKCYLFFDEIQNVDNWPLVIRRLSDSKNLEIYLTGSSAKLLSKEIATSLRGRSLAIEMWPYNFSEFMRAKKMSIERDLHDKKTQDKLKQAFYQYLSSGGFPELIWFDVNARRQTLQEYIDVTIYRDIVERYAVKHPATIKYMLLSMIHNISRPFTLNKFYNDVRSQGHHVGKDILYEYASYIEDAYVAFLVPIYDSSLRKVQVNPKKIYAIDPGLVRSVTLDYDGDLGRLFENVVYLDLRRRRATANYYLTAERYEVDFVAQAPDGRKKLLQIAWDVDNQLTFDRERRALDAGMKELKIDGEMVTLDSYLYKGVFN